MPRGVDALLESAPDNMAVLARTAGRALLKHCILLGWKRDGDEVRVTACVPYDVAADMTLVFDGAGVADDCTSATDLCLAVLSDADGSLVEGVSWEVALNTLRFSTRAGERAQDFDALMLACLCSAHPTTVNRFSAWVFRRLEAAHADATAGPADGDCAELRSVREQLRRVQSGALNGFHVLSWNLDAEMRPGLDDEATEHVYELCRVTPDELDMFLPRPVSALDAEERECVAVAHSNKELPPVPGRSAFAWADFDAGALRKRVKALEERVNERARETCGALYLASQAADELVACVVDREAWEFYDDAVDRATVTNVLEQARLRCEERKKLKHATRTSAV